MSGILVYSITFLFQSLFLYLADAHRTRRFTCLMHLFAVLFISTLVVGLKYEVSADWLGYTVLMVNHSTLELRDILTVADPLYAFLNWFSFNFITSELWFVNSLVVIVFLSGLFRFCHKENIHYSSIIYILPYYFFVFANSANRQAIALGFILLAISSQRLVSKLVFFLFAILSHASAGLFVMFYFTLGARGMKRWLMTLFTVLALPIFFESTITPDRYVSVYLNDTYESFGAQAHVALVLIPFFILGFKSSTRLLEFSGPLFKAGTFFALLLFVLSFEFSTAASRFSYYFSWVSLVTVAVYLDKRTPSNEFPCSYSLSVPNPRAFLNILLLSFIILILYFTFGFTAFSFSNYNNFMLL